MRFSACRRLAPAATRLRAARHAVVLLGFAVGAIFFRVALAGLRVFDLALATDEGRGREERHKEHRGEERRFSETRLLERLRHEFSFSDLALTGRGDVFAALGDPSGELPADDDGRCPRDEKSRPNVFEAAFLELPFDGDANVRLL